MSMHVDVYDKTKDPCGCWRPSFYSEGATNPKNGKWKTNCLMFGYNQYVLHFWIILKFIVDSDGKRWILAAAHRQP